MVRQIVTLESMKLSSPPAVRSRSATIWPRIGAGAAAVLGAVVLSGCTNSVNGIDRAEDATNPMCSEAMLAMPESVADFERARTDSQSTAAWGDPAAVVLRCGVPVPGPTTEHCVTANGVDWITEEEGENWRLTTYGRDPAVEVLFDATRAPSSSVMVDLSGTASQIPSERECSSSPDATQSPSAPSGPNTAAEQPIPSADANP